MTSSLIRTARTWCLALLTALSSLAALAQPDGFAEWPGRVGRVVEVQGGARLLDRADGQWISGIHNRPLTTGDRLATEPGARVELRVGSTTLRLAGQTDIEWLRLDDAALVLRLNAGSIALNIAAAELVPQVEVITAEGHFRPLQRGHYRIDRRDEASHGTTWRGELRFEGADSELVIPVGYHAEFWLQGPSQVTHYHWLDVERDAFSDWVARDERPQERREATRYVSPEMTGWEDLDQYGRWQVHPEYGGIWVPASVPAGWAPYRMGHWDWIAPWGWTWIDAAPWGFAPFHYGRWVWWGGRWCWAPGQRELRPVYSPALVAWIGGAHLSIGVRIGSPIAWLPLGPRDPYHPYRRDHDRDRGHDRDHGRPTPNPPRPPGTVPTGPIMYTNQGVPGAVTAVPGDAFAHRRPVAPAVIADVRPGPQPLTPQAPPTRVVPPVPLAPAVPATGPVPPAVPATGPVPRTVTPVPVPPVPVAPSRPDATRPGRVVEPVMPGSPTGPGQRSGPEAPPPRPVHPVPLVQPGPATRSGSPAPASPTPVPPVSVAPPVVAPPVVAPVPVAPTPVPPVPVAPSRTAPTPSVHPVPAAPARVEPPRPPRPPEAERKDDRKEDRKEDRKDDGKKRVPERREGPRDRSQVE